ncbi:MAG: hypothetical protein K2M48_03930 [Clostridiales bacterium]|nr:hypothetical protein [Clostridiales bacterium]
MLEALSKFYELIPSADIWFYIVLGIVGLTFLITLIIGLAAGEFKHVKSLMKQAVAHPQSSVAVMKQMPVAIKKQYKHARMINAEPSMFVTEQLCVDLPYKRSLLSKVWIATFVATLICSLFALGLMGFGVALVTTLLVGGLLTFIGAIVGRASCGGARKTYVSFVAAIDGEKRVADFGAPAQPEPTSFDRTSEPSPVMGNYAGAEQAPETVYADAEATAFAERAAQPFEAQAEPVQAEPVYGGYAEPVQNAYAEPQQAYTAQQAYAEPVVEPVVTVEPQESEAEIRRRAREEALAQARAQQQAQAAQAAAAQAQAAQAAAQAQAAAAQAQAAAQAAAQAQAAQAQAAQNRAAQTQATAAHGSSSADDIIARIEQIDREGAPRETMREVATLLQKERSKPENKTPEQQKKLNEALSKLLKAMSSANRK